VIINSASETDESLISAKVLNFDSPVSLKSPGVKLTDDKADDKVDDEAQMGGAKSVEAREEPQGERREAEMEMEIEIEQEGEFPGTILLDADRLLHTVLYGGDYVHLNSGQQLNGGVKDD
jgi:hypothetical protein